MRRTILSLLLISLSLPLFSSDHRAYHHYMLGEIHLLDDEYESAISEYVKASVYDSNSAYIRSKIASAYMQMGNTEFALYNVKKALELDPLNTEALILYSEILLLNEDLEKAVNTCSLVLEDEPDNRQAIQCKASALIGLKNYKDALKVLKDYSDSEPYDEQALYGVALVYNLISKTSEAERYYLNALRINPNHLPSAIDLMDLYLQSYKINEYVKKMEELADITDLKIVRDKLVRNYTALGIQNRSSSKRSAHYYKKAIEQLDILSIEYPSNSSIRIQKALLLEENGEPDKAILGLEEGLALFPKDERLMIYLATIYQKAGKTELALSTMEKILELNPDNPDALNYIAYSYAETNKDLQKAKDYVLRALKIVPDDPYVTDSLGWIYHKIGDNRNAATTLEKALSLAEKRNIFEPEMLEHLIYVYTELKQFKKIEQIKQTLLNSPVYADYRKKIQKIFEDASKNNDDFKDNHNKHAQ